MGDSNFVQTTVNMFIYHIFLLAFLSSVSCKVIFGPLAEKNHNATAEQRAVCDPDYGWLPGADGSNKCYTLVKSYGYDGTCSGAGDYWGMTFFDAMECCYYMKAYIAEPLSEAETSKINTYLTISNGGDLQNTYWIGGTDLHHEGSWLWLSGAPWSYTNWQDGEPNQNGNEDCTAINSDAQYKWMDLSCDSANHGVPHYVVCEKILE